MSNKIIPNLSVTDGFDFVKKIWGSLPIPSVMTPTTDLEELDKRISDLKAVEQWLNVNLSMLRATIQGLEVQRGTIATIKSFGSNLGLGSGERSGEATAAVNEEIIRNAVKAANTPPPVPRHEPVESRIPEAPLNLSAMQTKSTEANSETSKAIISNATAWWGVLQDQFNKVATAALSGSGLSTEPGQEVAKKAVKASVDALGKVSAPMKNVAKKSSVATKSGRRSSTSKKKTPSKGQSSS